ncbi:MAG: hypothetical protein ACRELC_05085, partial [Gemmatimonadota bacterium]
MAFGAVASHLLARWRAARGLACDLAVALRPLSLPILVLLLVAAARGLPLGVALSVFAVGLLFAVHLVFRPEWGTIERGAKLVTSLFETPRVPAPGITPFAVPARSVLRTFQLVVVPG